jgi:hypothetical protein
MGKFELTWMSKISRPLYTIQVVFVVDFQESSEEDEPILRSVWFHPGDRRRLARVARAKDRRLGEYLYIVLHSYLQEKR